MIFAIAVFAPLLGALVAGPAAPRRPRRPCHPSSDDRRRDLRAARVGSSRSYAGAARRKSHRHLDEVGRFHVDWALRYDTLSASMVAMVTAWRS